MSQIEINMDTVRLGACLRKRRVSHDMTQQVVAEELGVGRSTYAMYEVGVRKLTLEKAVQLARLYGITVDELINTTIS